MARLGVRREPTAPSFHVASSSRRLPPCVGPAEHSPMVVPHLPVIRAAAPPGILNAPLPTAAPGPHSAPRTGTQSPSPHSAPAPPHSYPGTGPPVPDQSPSLHFCPGGLGPDPSPQLPRDRAPSPRPRILPRGLGPHPAPQLPRDRALCLTRTHRRPSFQRPSSLEPTSLPANTMVKNGRSVPRPFLQVSCDRVRELANVGSSHRGRFFWARVDPHRSRAIVGHRCSACDSWVAGYRNMQPHIRGS
jgi:hypothetical protein